MKKVLKIILIIVGILVGIIILDTIQAKLFNNSPIIKITKDYYPYLKKDIGVFVETNIYNYDGSKETYFKWELRTFSFKSNKEVTEKELNVVNNKIIEYLSSDKKEYDNILFNYVDVNNKKVIVGLIENSKEQRERFKKFVVDSPFIEFIRGENIWTY